MDAVRSRSPKASRRRSKTREGRDQSREPSLERLRNKSSVSRSRQRGRPLEKTTDRESTERGSTERGTSLTKSAFGKLGDMLKLDIDTHHSHESPEWKVFKKGVYTYPISFSIPGNAPASIACPYGNITWRLKAHVHRPGAFQTKLTASREVSVVSCPIEDDTEETESINVERQWDSQLHYLISIFGKSFYIGGTIPIQLTLMPLSKMKIYRISVLLDEQVSYLTNTGRPMRADPVTRTSLLSLKHADVRKENSVPTPILPLSSDSPTAFMDSPLAAVVDPEASPSEISEFASSLMGPGPWTFRQNLKLPASCHALKFTTKNKLSNMHVTHTLKIVMRVERGDDEQMDPKTGRRKMFDIVVQTPIHILSCRCNPEWTSLPTYAEFFEDSPTATQPCPCRSHGPSSIIPLERTASHHSTDSAETVETVAIPATTRSLRAPQTLLDQNTQFERLISGQESVSGEAPPTYSIATAA